MKSSELLEGRADRGTARGAANVWASAQVDRPDPQPSFAPWTTRIALLAWTAAVAVAGYFAVTTDETSDVLRAQPADVPIESADPLPEALLVEGMELVRVFRPNHTGFDASDILEEQRISNLKSGDDLDNPPEDVTIVFADPDDQFNGPIVGLQLSNGGFRPWSANVDRSELDELLDQLVRIDGTWSMPEESGLVEVARISAAPDSAFEYGWQYDFKAGANEVTLQAETAPDPEEIDEWLWLSRLVGEGDVGPVVSEVEVLGQTGIRLQLRGTGAEEPADGPVDEVVWAADGFVYRMTVDVLDGDRLISGEATAQLDRLRIVDRAGWVDAVNAADRQPESEVVIGIVAIGLLAALAVLLLVLLIKREFMTAAFLVAGMALLSAAGLGLLSSGTPIWLLVIGALGMGLILKQSSRKLT